MRSILFFSFIVATIFVTSINAEEKTVTNPKGYTYYRNYATDLESGKGAIQTPTDNKITVDDYYKSHRTLMLGLFLMKEEDAGLTKECDEWFNKTYGSRQIYASFDDAFYQFYDDMQDFYYDHLEEKLGTIKMGEYAAQYYTKIWDVYLSKFVDIMKGKDYPMADSSAPPSVISQIGLLGIGIFSALGYYFANY